MFEGVHLAVGQLPYIGSSGSHHNYFNTLRVEERNRKISVPRGTEIVLLDTMSCGASLTTEQYFRCNIVFYTALKKK